MLVFRKASVARGLGEDGLHALGALVGGELAADDGVREGIEACQPAEVHLSRLHADEGGLQGLGGSEGREDGGGGGEEAGLQT